MKFSPYKTYFVQPTAEGIYVFFISARVDQAYEAYMEFAGTDNALFIRTPSETVLLTYLNASLQEDLLKCTHVEIAEVNTDTEEIVQSYRVPIRQVPFIAVAN